MGTDVATVLYRTDAGVKPAVVKPGRKWLQVVTMHPDLRVARVPRAEARYMTPTDTALSRWRGVARRHGATKLARQIIGARRAR